VGMIIGCDTDEQGGVSLTIFTPMHAIIDDICSVTGAKGAQLPQEEEKPVMYRCDGCRNRVQTAKDRCKECLEKVSLLSFTTSIF
jgi:hypothetical protein